MFARSYLVVLFLAGAAPVAAQDTTGFQDGFFIQPDPDNRLVFGFIAQTDGRFSLDEPLPITNTFALRKARPVFSGRIARYFDFRLMPDFGSGGTVILDAYFDVRLSPKLRIRAGKDKTPVGYELMQGDAYILFPERALPSSLVPNRDVGLQAQGDLGPKVFYAGGIFNGVPDGVTSTADVDTNNSKDVAGRIVVQPFRTVDATSRLNSLGFQIGGSAGTQAGALPSFRTSVGQAYFTYATGSAAAGMRTRIAPALFYYYKALGVFGEYIRSSQRISGSVSAPLEVTNRGWEVTTSYVLTGEATSDRGVRPRAPFDPPAGAWGAVQLLARYASLDVDAEIFTARLAAPGSASRAQQVTIGLNWYPTYYIKYHTTFERTTFEEGSAPARADENVILFRIQLGF